MLDIQRGSDGTIALVGRLDAASAPRLQAELDALAAGTRLDFSRLDYVSSAGLGVLLKTQKRLSAAGGLTLVKVNAHILDVFRYSGFDQIFKIEAQ